MISIIRLAPVLLGLALTVGQVRLLSAGQQIPPPSRPNIVVIYTDDQRHDAMGCAGNPIIRTPNLDTLASRGIRFSQAFVTLSICSPSRATCLTGRHATSNGVTRIGQPLNAEERTFAHYLKQAGYQTGFIGKWHIGQSSPQDNGFDFAVYFEGNGPQKNRAVIEQGRPAIASGFIEDYNAAQAIRFMTDAAETGRPFLLHLCTQVPHMTPERDWQAHPETLMLYDESRMPVPESWGDNLAGKPTYLKTARSRLQAIQDGYQDKAAVRRHTRKYYAAITDLDTALGRVFRAIDSLGLQERTYVFVMGDNGWFLGEHGFTSKVLAYEESIRVPFLVAGPGLRHGVDDHIVLNADIAPTLLDLAGLPIPENMQGRSLVPLMTNASAHWRKAFLYEAPESQLGSWPLLAVRTERYKYIQTFDINDRSRLVFEELYDLRQDPYEMVNLAGLAASGPLKNELANLVIRLRPRMKSKSPAPR